MPEYLLPAPAKVNVHLRVLARRGDGRHDLDTSFAFVDLCDHLRIAPSDQLRVRCSTAHLNGEANLVYRVLQGLRRRYGVRRGLDVYIEKRIPEQAGLGGGSSDAATALLAARRIWRLPLGRRRLMAFAKKYGADIPCFLFGRRSWAGGVGDRLRNDPRPLPAPFVCLAQPDGGLSTARVFACWDALTGVESGARVRAAFRQVPSMGENDLESAACDLLPGLRLLLDAMRGYGERMAWMTGSGSCCLALCSSQEEAEALASALRASGLARWSRGCRLLSRHPLGAAWATQARESSMTRRRSGPIQRMEHGAGASGYGIG